MTHSRRLHPVDLAPLVALAVSAALSPAARAGNKLAGPYTIARDGAGAGASVRTGTLTPAP